MPRYFQNMPVVGKPVRANEENANELRAIEEEIHGKIKSEIDQARCKCETNQY